MLGMEGKSPWIPKRICTEIQGAVVRLLEKESLLLGSANASNWVFLATELPSNLTKYAVPLPANTL